jgi:AAA domain/RepB DNA-primase from phage plasmid
VDAVKRAALTPEQQLKVLARIWRNERGYVFLPVIPGTAHTAAERRRGYREGPAFAWPRQRAAILQRLQDHQDDDQYFTPALFNGKHRWEHLVVAESCLWADLDDAPEANLNGLAPNVMWQTSPGRRQGVWLLSTPKVGASWYGNENHRLTLHIGADPSGWDSTQLLRVPGTVNHKPGYGDGGVQGHLYLPVHAKPYSWRAFDGLPELPAEELGAWPEDAAIAEVDTDEVWGRIKDSLPTDARRKFLSRSTSGDTSNTLWYIEMSLAEAGCTEAEIVALMWDNAWNKYKGRQDELTRLKTEAAKATGKARAAASSPPSKGKQPAVDGRRTRLTWAIDIEPEPVTWVWEPKDDEGRIARGTLVIGGGREGTGKSSFGIWLAAQITRGKLPGAWYGKPRRVLYAAVEDSWKFTIVPRLMAAGADRSMVARIDVVTEGDEELVLSLPHDNKQLERDIVENDVGLVVVDPITSVISEDIDTHHTRQVRRALDPLAQIADRTNSVIYGIAHFNKGSGTDVASLLSGSHAFRDVPRATFGFARDDEAGVRVMSQVKNSLGRDDLDSFTYMMEPATVDTKLGPAKTARFAFTGMTERSVTEVLKDKQKPEQDDSDLNFAVEWLTAYMAENSGRCNAKEATKAAAEQAISKTTLYRARKKVGVETDKTGMTSGWAWTLQDMEEL